MVEEVPDFIRISGLIQIADKSMISGAATPIVDSTSQQAKKISSYEAIQKLFAEI